jgi:NitT/TauT family transport system substrate-binding protein
VYTQPFRRRELLLTGVSAAVLGMPAWSQDPPTRAPGASTLDIMLDELEQLRHLPLYLAQNLGFFDQEQLHVKWIHVPAQAQSLEEQSALRTEVFAGGFERVLYMHANNQPVQAFLMVTRNPGVVLGGRAQLASIGHTTNTVNQWAGLRWAVGPPGGYLHRMALLVLLRAGLRAQDVQWVHFSSEAQIAWAFEAQKVDVVAVTELLATQLERTGQLRVLVDTRTQRDTEWMYGGPSAGLTLSANPMFIERHTNTIQKLTQAVLKAMVWMRTATPTDLTRHLPKGFTESSASVFFGAWTRSHEVFSTDGLIPEGAALNMLKSLHRLQWVSDVSGINPLQTFNNRFAVRARQQLRA